MKTMTIRLAFAVGVAVAIGGCTALANIASTGAVAANHELVLTPATPAQVLTVPITAPGHGNHRYTVVKIDTRAFTSGGILTIEAAVGDGESGASFDLLPAGSEFTVSGYPQGSLAYAYDIQPNGSATMRHHFATGQVFRLGAEGNWFSSAGSTNTVRIRAVVED
jgi:hypothetical protein